MGVNVFRRNFSKFFDDVISERLPLCKVFDLCKLFLEGLREGCCFAADRSIKLRDSKVFRNHNRWRYFFFYFSENSSKRSREL